jgi:hypothetical protein
LNGSGSVKVIASTRAVRGRGYDQASLHQASFAKKRNFLGRDARIFLPIRLAVIEETRARAR